MFRVYTGDGIKKISKTNTRPFEAVLLSWVCTLLHKTYVYVIYLTMIYIYVNGVYKHKLRKDVSTKGKVQSCYNSRGIHLEMMTSWGGLQKLE